MRHTYWRHVKVASRWGVPGEAQHDRVCLMGDDPVPFDGPPPTRGGGGS